MQTVQPKIETKPLDLDLEAAIAVDSVHEFISERLSLLERLSNAECATRTSEFHGYYKSLLGALKTLRGI